MRPPSGGTSFALAAGSAVRETHLSGQGQFAPGLQRGSLIGPVITFFAPGGAIMRCTLLTRRLLVAPAFAVGLLLTSANLAHAQLYGGGGFGLYGGGGFGGGFQGGFGAYGGGLGGFGGFPGGFGMGG